MDAFPEAVFEILIEEECPLLVLYLACKHDITHAAQVHQVTNS